jgi:hypothetical protein
LPRCSSQRLYNGKNRTPYVKDAFNDYVIPSHRPKEPEPESSTNGGLATKKSKSPKLPGGAALPETGEASEENDGAENTDSNGDVEAIVQPPPRPASAEGGRKFVNPEQKGTKAAAHYVFNAVPGKGGCVVVRLKMTPNTPEEDPSILDEELFDDVIEDRRVDADEFYGRIARGALSDDLRNVMRQALSGMMW